MRAARATADLAGWAQNPGAMLVAPYVWVNWSRKLRQVAEHRGWKVVEPASDSGARDDICGPVIDLCHRALA